MSRIPDFSQIPFQQAPAQGAAEFAAWKGKIKKLKPVNPLKKIFTVQWNKST